MHMVAENYEQTHTHTRDNYLNPRCACARKVNEAQITNLLAVDNEALITLFIINTVEWMLHL